MKGLFTMTAQRASGSIKASSVVAIAAVTFLAGLGLGGGTHAQ